MTISVAQQAAALAQAAALGLAVGLLYDLFRVLRRYSQQFQTLAGSSLCHLL